MNKVLKVFPDKEESGSETELDDNSEEEEPEEEEEEDDDE